MFKNVLIVAGLTTTLFASAASAASAGANLVVNGSFEQVQIGSPFNSGNAADIPAWTHTGAAGDAVARPGVHPSLCGLCGSISFQIFVSF